MPSALFFKYLRASNLKQKTFTEILKKKPECEYNLMVFWLWIAELIVFKTSLITSSIKTQSNSLMTAFKNKNINKGICKLLRRKSNLVKFCSYDFHMYKNHFLCIHDGYNDAEWEKTSCRVNFTGLFSKSS